jgi:hypothetical protein
MPSDFRCREASQIQKQRELHLLRFEALSDTHWTEHLPLLSSR